MNKVTKTTLWLADNLDYLRTQASSNSKDGIGEGMVDLIYIDPPFNSKRNYNIVFDAETDASEQAFSDVWSRVAYLDLMPEINSIAPELHKFLVLLKETGVSESMLSYLSHMAIRCYYMRKMLKETGSFYYHCDPTASHYIKIVLDYIFGDKNFRNEIVWSYKRWAAHSNQQFQKMHDIIFFYSKGNNTLNKITEPLARPKKQNKNDGNGKSIRDMDGNVVYHVQTEREVDDTWAIPFINPVSKERLGYPTQKPEALLERIIKASSNEGDLVADFFLGGGTTAAVCRKLNRNFLGMDLNYRAIQITKERLESQGAVIKKDLIIHGIPSSSKDLRRMVDENIIGHEKNSRFELEDITVKYYLKGVVGNSVKVGDGSIDGRFGFTHEGVQKRGIVQVTSGSNKNHLKAFCSEIGKGNADMGVYVTFADNITDGFVREVKGYGKIGGVDKIQLLSFEDLIDRRIQFQLPLDGSLF